jgi:hypothetical protein
MTVAHSARRTARKAANSHALEMLTRTGFIGYGLLHLAFAWLALQIALGRPQEEGDQSGAFRTLQRQPMGRVLLIIIIVGLAAMAIWQLLEAWIGHRDERGFARTAERIISVGRVIAYAALAWTAEQVISGGAISSASQQQSTTAGLLGQASGRLLVTLGGLAVVGIGAGMTIYGARRKFARRLRIGQMTRRTRKLAIRLGQVGYIAKGIAFAIVGLLLLDAALTHNVAQARGLDAALRTVADQPFGVFLLILIAAGFAAFGGYCFFQSKYRKV